MRTSSTSVMALFVLCIGFGSAFAHTDSAYLTDACGSCHVGHGMSGEPMLELAEEAFCYQCHGDDAERARMVQEGRLLAGAPLADIEREFAKPYRHPVDQTGGHSAVEELPLATGGSTGHSECVDCHSPHQRRVFQENGMSGVPGFTLSRQIVQNSTQEIEVCLKCHADRLGIETARESLIEAFSVSAVSQHPITKPMNSRSRSSLTSEAAQMTTMTCSDCHTSDDANGPRGPHGSRFQFLLSGNYELGSQVDESPYAYEFCYSCHDRSSLLSDETFEFHSLHIQGGTTGSGTSCYTCHASHGSIEYPSLLRFVTSAVSPEANSRRLEYLDMGEGAGSCWLSCHGHEHAGAEYGGGL